MVYRIVMENDNETIKLERNSLLIAIAKARVWSQEGWNVVVTDSSGNVIEASEFDRLLAA
jgi:hypothetical protein